MHRCFCLLAVATLISAAQIVAPHVGFFRTAEGQLRPVEGLEASFVLRKPLRLSAVSANFSDQAGIVLEKAAVSVLDSDGRVVADYAVVDPDGTVGISTGVDTAIAWLPATRTLMWFNGTSFEKRELAADLPGKVVNIRRDGQQALLLLDEGKAVSEASG